MSQPVGNVQPPLPDEFEDLDFEIVQENWNEYELHGGDRIKGRIFLHKIVRDPNNPSNYSIRSSAPMYAVIAPVANRGERNHEPLPQDYNTLPRYEVQITNSNERWNIYRILRTGQTMRLRLTVTAIHRATDRFDRDGIPFYLVTAGPMIIADPQNLTQGQ
jgi:hypothetical protein